MNYKKAIELNEYMSKTSKKQRKSKGVLIACAGVIVLLVAAIFFVGYYAYNSYNDKKKFIVLEKEIINLKGTLDSADSLSRWSLDRNCQRAHVKFQDGDVYCAVGIQTTRRVDSTSQVRDAVDLSEKILQDDSSFKKVGDQQAYPILSDGLEQNSRDVEDGYGGVSYISVSSMIKCNTYYSIERSEDPADSSIRSVELTSIFACRDKALAEYYPRSDR